MKKLLLFIPLVFLAYPSFGNEEQTFTPIPHCSTNDYQREVIYDKCIIDKMPVGAKATLANSVRDECKRISCNPSWWESFWYN